VSGNPGQDSIYRDSMPTVPQYDLGFALRSSAQQSDRTLWDRSLGLAKPEGVDSITYELLRRAQLWLAS
jgi:hypothetical protein